MSDNAAVRSKVSQYLLLKKEIADLKAMQERVKIELEPYLQEADTNARGSHVIQFAAPLEIHGVRYKELQKVRKESKVLNEERVLEWAYKVLSEAERDQLIVVVQHIDHDALFDFYAQDLLTEEEYASLFDVTQTWAFAPTKE